MFSALDSCSKKGVSSSNSLFYVVEPGYARHSILGMEDVGGGGVVQDDNLVEVTSKSAQVLHVVATVEDAGLSEQPGSEHVPLVQQVRHRVGVLGQAGRKEDALVQPAHLLQELVHMRPL